MPKDEFVAEVVGDSVGSGVGSAVSGYFPESPAQLGSVRWEGYSHGEMWGMLMRSRPDSMFQKAEDWATLGTNVQQLNDTVQQHLASVLGSWRGSAAAGMANSGTALLGWANEASQTTGTVAADMENYTNALVRARHSMPQPRHATAEKWFRDGDGATVASGPEGAYMLQQLLTDHRADAEHVHKAKKEAVHVMRRYEHESADIERTIGTYRTAPTVTAQGGGPDRPPMPGPPSPLTPHHPGPNPAPLPNDPNDPGGSTDSPDGTGIGGTTTSSFDPVGAGSGGYGGLGGGVGGIGGVGGGDSALSGGRVGALAPGGSAGAALGAGGTVGVGGAVGPGGVIGTGPAGVAGRGGVGAGGMIPPGAARGDRDAEHRRSRYLVGEDLFDDEQPLPPAVLDANRPDPE